MSRRGLLGVAAGACVACCVGPFLAVIGGIAALGAVGATVFGVVAVAVAGAVVAGTVAVRRRTRARAPLEPQLVELGRLRR